MDCKSRDLPLIGYPYTWGKGCGTKIWVHERLDRAICMDNWPSYFDNAELYNFTCFSFDYDLILLVVRKQ
jgi:hypothetical protein